MARWPRLPRPHAPRHGPARGDAPMISDDAMVAAAARAGSGSAFDAIVERYHTRIARYLYRLVGDEELARDLAQDTCQFLITNKAVKIPRDPRMVAFHDGVKGAAAARTGRGGNHGIVANHRRVTSCWAVSWRKCSGRGAAASSRGIASHVSSRL